MVGDDDIDAIPLFAVAAMLRANNKIATSSFEIRQYALQLADIISSRLERLAVLMVDTNYASPDTIGWGPNGFDAFHYVKLAEWASVDVSATHLAFAGFFHVPPPPTPRPKKPSPIPLSAIPRVIVLDAERIIRMSESDP